MLLGSASVISYLARCADTAGREASGMTRANCRGGLELVVFKGREAKLNFAIFIALAVLGPLSINELHKQVSRQKGLSNLYYASLTKRLHCLTAEDYLKENKPKQGSKASIFTLTNKAHLAIFLHLNSMQDILDKSTEKKRALLLVALINALSEES